MKYSCRACKYHTFDISNYMKHNKTNKHLKISTKVSLQNEEKNEEKMKRNEEAICTKIFNCSHCTKVFENKSNKARHLKQCKQKYVNEQEESKEIALKQLIYDKKHMAKRIQKLTKCNNKLIKENESIKKRLTTLLEL